MQMQVKDGLTRVRARVHHGAIALLGDPFGLRDLRRHEHQTPDLRSVGGLVQRRYVLLRDDENVRRSLRVDVAEGYGMLVFVNHLCGNLAPDDAAEETALGHVDLNSARERARPAMPAVSNRRTFAPSDAVRQPASAKALRSAESRPPSGPRAMTTGGCVAASASVNGAPAASSSMPRPVGTAPMTSIASASGSMLGSHAPPDCSRAAIIRRRSFSWNAVPSPRGVTLRERRYTMDRHADAPSSTDFSASVNMRSRSPTGAQTATCG